MGIVRLLGRGAVRLFADACECERRRVWTEAPVVGEWRVVVPALVLGIVPTAGATQRATDRMRIRRNPGAARERVRVS
jgi:hypothetical protein